MWRRWHLKWLRLKNQKNKTGVIFKIEIAEL